MGVKSVSKNAHFCSFLLKRVHFCSFLIILCSFFYHIILAYFAHTLQTNLATCGFRLKTTIDPKITPRLSPKNTIFLKKFTPESAVKMIDFLDLLIHYETASVKARGFAFHVRAKKKALNIPEPIMVAKPPSHPKVSAAKPTPTPETVAPI